MQTTKKLAAQIILACKHFSINQIVISPGSRNAPLTIGFATNDFFTNYSIVDERCAAFFALGIAQQTQKTVALVCTSGSALLNYYPAIAEAFYSNIPLVILSADRPKHLIDIGDGQTIRQENVFQNHVCFSANLNEGELLNNGALIIEALEHTIQQKKPVHINIPFDEPLYNQQDSEQMEGLMENIFQVLSTRKKTKIANLHDINFPDLIKIWNSSKRKLILVGVNYPNKNLNQILTQLSENDTSVLVMTETTSNLHHANNINSIDKLITNFNENDFLDFQPDLLITLGGFIVSKRIKQLLRTHKPLNHWHIDEFTKLDTYFALTHHIETNPSLFFSKFIDFSEKVSSTYQTKFTTKKEHLNTQHQHFMTDAPYSDLKVVECILKHIPNNTQLQISNSSMIRYVQLFDINQSLSVFCNRGTSGIDGSTSTAIGASVFFENQTTLLTGDISFFYDSNALWNKYIRDDFRIILVNNDGGGIFKIIPGPKNSEALPYFETKHKLTAEHLAKMFNFEYSSAKNLKELNNCLSEFYEQSSRPKLLEVFTPSDINDIVLKNYFKTVK